MTRATSRTFATIADHAALPLFLIGAYLSASTLQRLGVPNLLVTPLIVGPFAGLIAILERARPDRASYKPLDLPFLHEAAHYIFNFEFGYGLSLLATALFERSMRLVIPASTWPAHWPLALQLLLAILCYEGTSYWQHRLVHRVPWLWRFHALHHSGTRLNFLRAVRFHFVDIATAAFVSYVPLAILGAPDSVVTLLAILLSVMGILQHANLRMRSPAWLDRLICTPAVHRHHHSSAPHEGDTNFGNSVMLFDMLFGTYGAPRPAGPAAVGIEDDPVPRDFIGQTLGPFRRARSQRSTT